MALEVIWSREAFKTYFSNIQYLKIQWSAKEIDRFIRQAEYCRLQIQKKKVILLSFWNTRQDPEKLQF
ncbi:MAG: hypothetical protein ACK5PC_12055 [Cyclobacteriaceae bacterium]|jgi:hypothetical protein|nr:hypothetical protein [Flammeovirgaceae bacterium]